MPERMKKPGKIERCGRKYMGYRRKALFTLVEIAQQMLAGKTGPIEGSRKISRLRFDVEDEDDPFEGEFR